jgi:hypothetical protein
MLTGLVGTMMVLLGYVLMALRRNPAVAFTLGSAIWVLHATLHRDWWLLTCNVATSILGTISILRGRSGADARPRPEATTGSPRP